MSWLRSGDGGCVDNSIKERSKDNYYYERWKKLRTKPKRKQGNTVMSFKHTTNEKLYISCTDTAYGYILVETWKRATEFEFNAENTTYIPCIILHTFMYLCVRASWAMLLAQFAHDTLSCPVSSFISFKKKKHAVKICKSNYVRLRTRNDRYGSFFFIISHRIAS